VNSVLPGPTVDFLASAEGKLKLTGDDDGAKLSVTADQYASGESGGGGTSLVSFSLEFSVSENTTYSVDGTLLSRLSGVLPIQSAQIFARLQDVTDPLRTEVFFASHASLFIPTTDSIALFGADGTYRNVVRGNPDGVLLAGRDYFLNGSFSLNGEYDAQGSFEFVIGDSGPASGQPSGQVPEPTTFAAFAIGGCIAGFGFTRRRRED
jgi:hypothetical protein